jgi:hypothetical protein
MVHTHSGKAFPDARFDVLMAVKTEVVAPCTCVVGCRRFRGPHCTLVLFALQVYSSMLEAARSSEALVSCRDTARRPGPEGLDFKGLPAHCRHSSVIILGSDF